MFKELIKEIKTAETVKLPKIKGHTKIELTDIHTGKKETIEHDNVFQSAIIAKYFRSMGAFNNNPFANDSFAATSMIKNLLGGILLFRDTITAGAEYMPAGNQMTANGAMDLSNAATPVELGSYNSIESVINDTTIQFVYDWNTAQGNGTISCVCLTSQTGGIVGYGNPSGGAYSGTVELVRNQTSKSFSGIVLDNVRYTFSLNNSTKELTVNKYHITVDTVALNDGALFETLTLPYDTALTQTGRLIAHYAGDGKIMLVSMQSSNYAPISGTFYFLVYDTENDTLSEGKIINTSGASLAATIYYYPYGTSYLLGLTFSISGDYVYVTGLTNYNSTNNKMHKFNWKTGAFIETITLTAPAGVATYTNSFTFMSPIAPNLRAYSGENSLVIYDMVSNTAHPCNAKRDAAQMGYNDTLDVLQPVNTNNSCLTYKNPLYLATINNLDTPVDKTASKTMKVTYTLTYAE